MVRVARETWSGPVLPPSSQSRSASPPTPRRLGPALPGATPRHPGATPVPRLPVVTQVVGAGDLPGAVWVTRCSGGSSGGPAAGSSGGPAAGSSGGPAAGSSGGPAAGSSGGPAAGSSIPSLVCRQPGNAVLLFIPRMKERNEKQCCFSFLLPSPLLSPVIRRFQPCVSSLVSAARLQPSISKHASAYSLHPSPSCVSHTHTGPRLR